MFIARRFGAGSVVTTISEQESANQSMYDAQPEASPEMPADERSHARLFRELAGGRGLEGPALARIERRHRALTTRVLRWGVPFGKAWQAIRTCRGQWIPAISWSSRQLASRSSCVA